MEQHTFCSQNISSAVCAVSRGKLRERPFSASDPKELLFQAYGKSVLGQVTLNELVQRSSQSGGLGSRKPNLPSAMRHTG